MTFAIPTMSTRFVNRSIVMIFETFGAYRVEPVGMQFADLLALIHKQLEDETRLQDRMDADAEAGVWQVGDALAELHPSTSTGLLLILRSNGRAIHERIFAASEVSVNRIARTITEHLTGYVAEKPR
jgi:hypothetical protein